MELFKLLGKIAINNSDANSDIDNTADKAKKLAKEMGESFGKVGKTMTTVGKKLLPVTTAIGGIGIASTKMSSDFTNALAKVSTIADTSQVPMADLRKAIMDLSNQTGISSAEIADNVYNAISAGQQTGDAVNFVSNATKLAKAGFTDSAASLDVLTTVMNAYGLEAEKVNDVSDMLITTQNLGKTTVGELAGSMGKVIPTANAYGVELDQICTGYAIMTANGINTAESTTYINSMLNELGRSGTKVSDVLKEQTGKSFQELMGSGKSLSDVLSIVDSAAKESGLSMGDMFGSAEAAKAALVMLGDGADDFNDILVKMNDSTGATDVAFNKMQTNSEKARIAFNKIKNTMTLLGDVIMSSLAPALDKLSSGAEKLFNWFGNLSPEMQQFTVIVGGLVAAIGPLLIVIGKMATGWGAILKVLPQLAMGTGTLGTAFTTLTGPVGIVIGVIGALIGVFTHLYLTNEEFRNNVNLVWDEIKTKIGEVCTAIGELINTFIEFIKPIWDAWGQSLITIAKTAFNIISTTISSALSIIQSIIKTITSLIKGDWQGVWNGMKNIIQSVWEAIKNIVTTVLNGIKNVVSSVWNSVKNTISNVVNSIKDSISSGFNAAKDTVFSIFTKIKDKISEKINGAKDAVHNAIEKIKSKFNFSWSLPHLKLPHISISGKFNLLPPSVPKFGIEWYSKGGVMTKPTMFDYDAATNMAKVGGESGPEAVAPISTLQKYIRDAVGDDDKLIDSINSRFDKLFNILEKYLPMMNQQLVLDTGVLVGEIADQMDVELGEIYKKKGRGV